MTPAAGCSKGERSKKCVRSLLRHPSYLVPVVITIAALIGLQGCAANDSPTVTEAPSAGITITADLDQLIDDYFAAYNNYDFHALTDVITDGYVLYVGRSFSTSSVSTPICDAYDADEMRLYIEGENKEQEYHFERVGEPIVSGNGPWLVSQVIFETSNDHPNGVSGISIFTIVDEGGALKIARDIFAGLLVR